MIKISDSKAIFSLFVLIDLVFTFVIMLAGCVKWIQSIKILGLSTGEVEIST